jgi:hypothetical protein
VAHVGLESDHPAKPEIRMKPKLVKIDVVLAMLGQSARKVYALADGGTINEPGFLGVFNLAANPKARCRDLRFWFVEVENRAIGNPTIFAGFNLDQVLAEILPPRRANFRAGEVSELFQIRQNTRIDLLIGHKTPAGFVYTRDELADFLKSRWIGANTN